MTNSEVDRGSSNRSDFPDILRTQNSLSSCLRVGSRRIVLFSDGSGGSRVGDGGAFRGFCEDLAKDGSSVSDVRLEGHGKEQKRTVQVH